MAENKTKQTELSVTDFVNQVTDEQKKKDSFSIIEIMQEITNTQPKMWGPSIIGFGFYHYKYESGREGDMCKIGFSPRKQNITLYFKLGSFDDVESMFKNLGKYKTGKGCLYINKLTDINVNELKKIIKQSWESYY